ncbi:Transmembrane protein [Pleurotus pulmonarius]
MLSQADYNAAAYLRIASLAVAGFDFVQTLPVVWRFYRDQASLGRLTLSALLFFLIQFVSICCLVVSSTGFFYGHFTDTTCRLFYLVPPSFKVLQAMVSQAIIGVRAYNLSRRSKIVGWTLIGAYVVACAFQWITTLYGRQFAVSPQYLNCRGATLYLNGLVAWVYYVIAIAYDLTATTISVFYLLQHKISARTSLMYRLANMMLYDGLGYFLLLTSVNIVNLILYRSQNLQTAACSVGYAITWIMCQRLLLHLHNASMDRRMASLEEAVTITQDIDSARAASRALRSQFEKDTRNTFDLTVPDFDSSIGGHESELPSHVDVQVRIERTVKVETRPRTFELENYSRSAQFRSQSMR